jgi:hypothetical protein
MKESSGPFLLPILPLCAEPWSYFLIKPTIKRRQVYARGYLVIPYFCTPEAITFQFGPACRFLSCGLMTSPSNCQRSTSGKPSAGRDRNVRPISASASFCLRLVLKPVSSTSSSRVSQRLIGKGFLRPSCYGYFADLRAVVLHPFNRSSIPLTRRPACAPVLRRTISAFRIGGA